MPDSSSMRRSQFFMILILTDCPRAVRRSNLIAQAHSMERNQVLSAQTVDGEKQLCPTEIWLASDDVFHHEAIISLQHV